MQKCGFPFVLVLMKGVGDERGFPGCWCRNWQEQLFPVLGWEQDKLTGMQGMDTEVVGTLMVHGDSDVTYPGRVWAAG